MYGCPRSAKPDLTSGGQPLPAPIREISKAADLHTTLEPGREIEIDPKKLRSRCLETSSALAVRSVEGLEPHHQAFHEAPYPGAKLDPLGTNIPGIAILIIMLVACNMNL